MVAAVKTISELEIQYQDIVEMFALADGLIANAETAANPEAYVNEIEHLVETVVEAADTISEEFFVVINGKQAGKKASGAKIEASLRKTYTALSEFSRKASEATRKHAEKLVTKLKRQLEVVIAGIIEFVSLSLDRIMQKQDIEELKRRQERIAFMLHSMSQQPST